MYDITTWFFIWLAGVILALLCLIFFWGFEDNEGNIEVTGTRIVCYLSIAAIANWAIVVFYLIVGGMYLLVWIGELFTKATDVTIYKSEKKGKTKNKKQSKKK